MDCSTPCFPVTHHLLKFPQIHVHWIGDVIQLPHPLSPSSPSALNISKDQGLSLVSQLFTSGGQSIGTSASASALPVNFQGWFPLGLTSWISLLSPALQFESTNSLALSLLYGSTLTSIRGAGLLGGGLCFLLHGSLFRATVCPRVIDPGEQGRGFCDLFWKLHFIIVQYFLSYSVTLIHCWRGLHKNLHTKK